MDLPAPLPAHRLTEAVLEEARSSAPETDRISRLRHVWALRIRGRYGTKGIAQTFDVEEATVRADAAALMAAARYEMFQDAAANSSLLNDVISVLAASRDRLAQLQRQLDTFDTNQSQMVRVLEQVAFQDPKDPLTPHMRAILVLSREIRLIHKDCQQEEHHLLRVLERTGLLRPPKEDEVLRSAEASLDMRLLQAVANAVSEAVRSEPELSEEVGRRIIARIGRAVDGKIAEVQGEIMEQRTVDEEARLAVG